MLSSILPSESIPNLHETLRSSTHAAHVRLNRHPLLAGLTRPAYPLRYYWLVLVAYYHFYQTVEAAIENYLARVPTSFDYQPRLKRFWLQQDLAYGGIDPVAADWRRTDAVVPVLIEDITQLVGALYLIEGATLGGQIISHHLQTGLNITPHRGGRFFSAYGQETTVRWQEFLEFAEHACETPLKRIQASQTAIELFRRVEEILDEYTTRRVMTP